MEKRSVEIEDFLQDEEFLLWVKKPSAESNNYWKAWMVANPEHVPTMLKARELLLVITFKQKRPSDDDREEVLGNVIKKLDGTYAIGRSPVASHWAKKLIPVAASLVLVISVAFYFVYQQTPPATVEKKPVAESVTIKETPPGIKLQTILPDGSRVWLNADSRVSYDHNYGKKDRKICLTGEAFFEVEEDKQHPFIVQSGKLTITALGTSFNVRSLAEKEIAEVALVTGKVEVARDGDTNEKIVLNPGQKAMHNRTLTTLIKSTFSVEDEIGWKTGILVFDNARFQEIQRTLERWYGVEIHSESLPGGEWNYTGKFDNQSLELVLKRLAFIKGFRFKIEGNKVYLFN